MNELPRFMDLEPDIVTRLKSKLPPGVVVLCADELESVQEASQPVPAVHVIYNGYSVIETNSAGKAALVRLGWLVVVVVKHSGASAKAAAEAKQRAGPLVMTVLDALMGFRPDRRPGTPGLTLATPPRPTVRAPFHYFPNIFTADVPLTSRSN